MNSDFASSFTMLNDARATSNLVGFSMSGERELAVSFVLYDIKMQNLKNIFCGQKVQNRPSGYQNCDYRRGCRLKTPSCRANIVIIDEALDSKRPSGDPNRDYRRGCQPKQLSKSVCTLTGGPRLSGAQAAFVPKTRFPAQAEGF